MEDVKVDVSLVASEERKSTQSLIDKLPFADPIDAEEYLHLDDDEVIFVNSITDEDIVRTILGEEQAESDEEEEKEEKKKVSVEEACKAANVMLQFFDQQNNDIKLEFSETIAFHSIKRKIDFRSSQSKKQLRLDSFFESK